MNKNLKKVISTFAALTMALGSFSALAADFSDVADTASYKQAIDELVALKIVEGYEDGTFKPDDTIKRSEVAKMIVAAYGPAYTMAAESAANSDTGFTDVDSVPTGGRHWASGYIKTGVDSNFINGYGDGTFGPEDQVTYAQVVKMLMVCLGFGDYAESNGGWPNGYLTLANSYGVTNGVSASADTYVTRAQVAQLIDNALKTPIMQETSYTTWLGGQKEIMDGKGKDYQTLLTKNHKAYVAKGRVSGTYKSTGGAIEKDEVQLSIEQADNFDDEYYSVRTDETEALPIDAINSTTNAEDNLFTYADMLIQKNEDEDYVLLALTPSAKGTTVELDASDFSDDGDDTFTENEGGSYNVLRAYTDGSSRKKEYRLNSNAEMIVNGTNVGYVNNDLVEDYLINNKTGIVTLVDTPMDGNTSTDGKYDYVVVTYSLYGKVTSVDKTSTRARINVENCSDEITRGFVEIQLDDPDYAYTFLLNGEEVTIDDIQENDVLTITYDVNATFSDSSFYDVVITRDVVEGMVSKKGTDSDGKVYCEVDGTKYYFVKDSDANKVNPADSYVFYVDAYGYIVAYDDSTSATKYALLERAYVSTNTQEETAVLVTNGGQVLTMTVKDSSTFAALKNQCYSSGEEKRAPQMRMISYRTNSKGELTSFTPFWEDLEEETSPNITVMDNAEFNARSNKLGARTLSDNTVILDVSKALEESATSYKPSDVSGASVSSFADGQDYKVAFLNERYSDGAMKFVIILEGAGKFSPTSALAFINEISQGSDNTVATAYINGEAVSLEFDGYADDVQDGDVIAYSQDGDGLVDEYQVVFNTENEIASLANSDEAYKYIPNKIAADKDDEFFIDPELTVFGYENWYLKTGYAGWDDEEEINGKSNTARIAFGPILEADSGSVTLAVVGDDYQTDTSAQEFVEYNLADNVNVAMIDFTNRYPAIEAASTGSISKTNISDSAYVDEYDNVIDWTKCYNVKTAMVKVVDNEVTDILIILPAEA